jgi:hypothetical protein
MGMPAPSHGRARNRAKEIVEFWRNRAWLSGSSAPLHVHPLDLDKLEELIATALIPEFDPDGK